MGVDRRGCASRAQRGAGGTVTRLLALVAALAVSAAAGCARSGGPGPPAAEGGSDVRLTAAQREHLRLYALEPAKFHQTVDTTGVVDFDNDQATSVLAPFSGPVSRLLVSPGDRVKKDQPLALVESPDFAAAISAYRKALAVARTDRRLANLDKDLLEHHGVSQREADQAESDAVGAEADRDAALRALIALHVPDATIKDLDEGREVSIPGAPIRSPVSGTVVERLITPGELLQAGTTPCFTVADLSRMWVMAQLFGADLEAVSVGDAAEVVTGIGSNDFSGRVDNIAALVDPDTRAVSVRVVVDNPRHFLRKQMYVHVRIVAREESTGLLIPVSAVLHDDENRPFVYVAAADGSFARRHVSLGYRADDRYVVSAGLHAGEQIVVAGGLFVQFMQSQ